ncbi:MAG: substrate-binding domain-containing protein [Oscillospiraceae bacterium]|nr:substrate-binding domain-containing protein [Oscillospiraceae bacterium]
MRLHEAVVSQLAERYFVVQCGGCTDSSAAGAVRYDYEAAGFALTNELIHLGRRRIWGVTGCSRRGEPVSFMEQFLSGYSRAMADAGLPAPRGPMQDWGDEIFLINDYGSKDQYAAELLKLPPEKQPDAIIAPTGEGAALLIQAFRRYGLSVPEDISVAAFFSSNNNRSTYPYISCMDQDWNTLGYESMMLLSRMIRSGDRHPQLHLLDYRISLCGSTHRELYPFLERKLEDRDL